MVASTVFTPVFTLKYDYEHYPIEKNDTFLLELLASNFGDDQFQQVEHYGYCLTETVRSLVPWS